MPGPGQYDTVLASPLVKLTVNSRSCNSGTWTQLRPICLGTYVRTTIIDKLVLDFINRHAGLDTPLRTSLSTQATQAAPIESPPSPSTPTQTNPSPQLLTPHLTRRKVQIISLGAGTDTRFFRLLQHHPHLAEHLIYHELDFLATTLKKIQAIKRHTSVKDLLLTAASRATATGNDPDSGQLSRSGEDLGGTYVHISADGTALTSPLYNIHAVDLRDLAQPTSITRSHPPALPNLHPDIPTLLLSECCLTYLPAATSTALLASFATTLIPRPAPLEVVMYEPLHPHDVFGKTMRANLASRGISMPGVDAFPDLEAHERRLREVLGKGHSGQGNTAREDGEQGKSGSAKEGVEFEGWTIKDVWDSMVTVEEKERSRRCEMVDEEEEWVLLAGHYGVVRGWRTQI